MPITVAIVQQACRPDPEENLAALAAGVEEAAESGARIVLLPELHNHRYFCQREDAASFDLAEPVPGPTTDRLGEMARAARAVIVGSVFERRMSGVYHNTAVVLDTDGSLAGIYRKMHIPEDPGFHEKFYFTPGDGGFVPIDTSVARLGVLVCWDQWYPEAARLMALAGAELLLYPSAIGWDPGDAQDEQERQRQAWMAVQHGHAVANGLPVMASNRTGFEEHPSGSGDGLVFWGSSFICGPQGEVLAEASTDDAQVILATLDTGRSEAVRRMWPFLRDRRIDAYGDLVRRLRD